MLSRSPRGNDQQGKPKRYWLGYGLRAEGDLGPPARQPAQLPAVPRLIRNAACLRHKNIRSKGYRRRVRNPM